ncbi:SusC/RagA family TonB-linked outer membrane protein [Hymenobacter sp. HDW8]|uniref:SusC/RagA family TonB-linked outer membrane protein n=2 Tax=Hymenobacter TaxID=89966 RepID=UPI0014082E7E|nr:TonB-dependent receptor [Hymenobacter sp. HDW8]QIL75493.1 TonB-dependent receptor [Hymenobacter sp. HDW8]
MRKVLLLCMLMVCTILAYRAEAQVRTISGKVVASDGNTLPGVTVVVKGTTQGASTDANGTYTLASVPTTATTLVYSFIGYDTKEVAIGDKTTIDVSLVPNTTGLDEVVVIGYGTQLRRELTGSVATISGADIAQKPVQSFEQSLQGRAPGVNVTTPNGVLNTPPVVRIRGVNSINLSSSPLYVIDGIPAFSGNNSALSSVPNNPLSNVNPNDIESIEVLKDAAAAAIYGSRAAGGVILVTTKNGKKGQSRISLDSWVGWSKPVRLYEVLGAEDYMLIKNEAVRNLNANRASVGAAANNREGFLPSYDADGNVVNTRWYDYIYRTGFSHSNALNFSGGTEKTSYYASVGYTGQNGMLKNNEFKRLSGRINIDHKVYKNFTVGARIGYSNNYNSSPNSGSIGDAAFSIAGLGRAPLVLPPNVAARNPDGTPNINTAGNGVGPGANTNPAPNYAPLVTGYYNPLVDLENNYFTSEGNEIQGSLYANWEILKGLNVRTTYGLNNSSFEDQLFYTALSGDGYATGGQAANYFRTNKRWNWQNTAQYDRSFGNHNASILLGGEQQRTQVDRWGASRTQVADDFFNTYQGNYTNIAVSGNSQGENYLVSYFGRLTYDFNKKYLASINVRRDGYSAWGNEKWGNFYGASLGYIVSEEQFWKDAAFSNVFNFLKFTGSYGEVGNSQGINDFASLSTYGSGLYGSSATLGYSTAGNPDLTWETSKKTDVGFSFGLFQDRVQGDFSYYRNLVDGLILDVPQAPSRGVPNNTIAANVGSMRNTGIELNLNLRAIQGKDFSWTVNGNYTTLKNRVETLVTEGQRIATATSGLEIVNFTEVGRSVGEILAVPSLGVNPLTGQRMVRKIDGTVVQYNHLGTTGPGSTGWTTLDGVNTTAPTQLADGIYYGPTLPKWYGGFDNTFRYKNFDLGVFIQFSGGNYIYNGTKSGLHDQRFWNNEKDIMNRWTSENTNAEWPRVVYGDNVSNGSALIMSSNVEKGDFARLRNVALGYSVPSTLATRLGLATARVYVQVQNAALLTKYSGIDPEISTNGNTNTGAGVDRNSIGQARTFTAGFNIGF